MRDKQKELSVFSRYKNDFKECCIELDKWSPNYFNGFYSWAFKYINAQKELNTDLKKYGKLCEIREEVFLSLESVEHDKKEYVMMAWCNLYENKILKQKISEFKESLLKEFSENDTLVKDYIKHFNI